MLERIWFFVPIQKVPGSPCSIFTWVSLDQKRIVAVMANLEHLSPQFPVLTLFKKVCAAIWMINYFQPYWPTVHKRNAAKLCLHSCYFHDKCTGDLYSLVPHVQTFTCRTRHATFTVLNHHLSFRIPFVSFTQTDSTREPLHCRTGSDEDTSLIIIILTSWNIGSALNYPTYLHKLRLRLLARFIYSNHLSWVSYVFCIRGTFGKNIIFF